MKLEKNKKKPIETFSKILINKDKMPKNFVSKSRNIKKEKMSSNLVHTFLQLTDGQTKIQKKKYIRKRVSSRYPSVDMVSRTD